jgi:DNA-binding PadR family transcriptional regulator
MIVIARNPNLFYIIKEMKTREDPLGALEHILLLAVMRLGTNAYGMTVRREIESVTGRDISIGAVYATLARLESKGFIRAYAGEPTAERGGRAKRYFVMTANGKGALRNTHETIRNMSAGLKDLEPV